MAETKAKAKPKTETEQPVEQKKVKSKFDFRQVDAKQLREMRSEYAKYRMEIKLGRENNSAKLKQMRRDIARVQTNLNLLAK